MTEKKKTEDTLVAAGFAPEAVAEAVAASDLSALAEPTPVVLGGSAHSVLTQLRYLRKAGPVTVDAPIGDARDAVVVDGHHFAGQQGGTTWFFDVPSFEMACRVAGWRKVERDPDVRDRWRLS